MNIEIFFAQHINMKKSKILVIIFILIVSFSILSGCQNQSQTVLVDSISISKKNLYLAEGQTAEISAQVYPFNADNQNFEFVSSNNGVVTVDHGFVTAIKAGNATITAISEDGGFKDKCNVLVTTVKNNLALNNYNNMNMPFNISKEKEIDENITKNSKNIQKNSKISANSHNFIKVENQDDVKIDDYNNDKKSAKEILKNIKKRAMNEFNQDFDAGKNVFNQAKNEFDNTINSFKTESEQIKNHLSSDIENEKSNIISSYFDFQDQIFQSLQNISDQINQDIQNMKSEFVSHIDDMEQKLDSDEYVVDTKDMNGVKFVVITNKNAN